jgi:hypothetical protein
MLRHVQRYRLTSLRSMRCGVCNIDCCMLEAFPSTCFLQLAVSSASGAVPPRIGATGRRPPGRTDDRERRAEPGTVQLDPGYDVDAVDWLLDKLRNPAPERPGTDSHDPWQHGPVVNLFAAGPGTAFSATG